jgi:hypothetical protein
LTERIDLYVGVVVSLMFLAGCFLMIISVRERIEQRARGRFDDGKDRPVREK